MGGREMSSIMRGIFAALTTPFVNNQISLEYFIANLEKYEAFTLNGYVIAGSTGESVYLSDDECETLIRTAKKTVSSKKTIIAGTARESTQKTLNFTNRIADTGANAALILTPHYYKSLMNSDALKAHYLHIADNARIPIIIYSIPRNTGISPSSQLIQELSRHQNIIGMKDSSGNLAYCEEICAQTGSEFTFFLGAGSIIIPGLIMGAQGGILTLAAVMPELCTRMYQLFLENKWEEAKKLQLDLIPLNKTVTSLFGVPAAKYVLDIRGYHGGTCRWPLQPLDDNAKQIIKDILAKIES